MVWQSSEKLWQVIVVKYDVIIVGSGPSGCRTAQIVANAGYKVLIIEEHSEAGVPTQCTGFVSEKIGEIPEEIIINKIGTAKFCADSNGSSFEVKAKEPMRLMDRRAFDKFIYGEAVAAGAEFKFNTRFIGYEKTSGGLIVKTSNGDFESKVLVGADGPNSSVAKAANLKQPENVLFLVQVRAKGQYDAGTAELWFGSNVAPGNFAWVVPESENVARVGLMTSVHPRNFFEKFFEKRIGYSLNDENDAISDRLGDTIRYGLIEKSVADNVLLVGDAAAQVKPYSAGGLVYGQIGARYAGAAIVKALRENNFSEKFLLENYEKRWKAEIGKGIKRGMMFKKIFKSIQDKPALFTLIRKTRIANLAAFFDADFIGKD